MSGIVISFCGNTQANSLIIHHGSGMNEQDIVDIYDSIQVTFL